MVNKRFLQIAERWMNKEAPSERVQPAILVPRNTGSFNTNNAGYSFLEGDFGREADKEIQGKYGKFNAINQIGYNKENGVVQGSNPFYVIAVNEVLRDKGLKIRTATQADLERMLKTGEMDLRGVYEDTALVLRNEKAPNEYLAKDLMKQVKSREPKQRMPVMIPLNGLELQKDSNSKDGLSFKLTDESQIIYVPVLNKPPGNFSSEDINKKTGLPEKLGKGNRTLYTRDSGLSRLYLFRYLGLSSDWYGLASSSSNGRVVLVGGEATAN